MEQVQLVEHGMQPTKHITKLELTCRARSPEGNSSIYIIRQSTCDHSLFQIDEPNVAFGTPF